MRIHPLYCIVAITCSLVIFLYFTFRDKINHEYSSVINIVEKNEFKSTAPAPLKKSDRKNLWEISRIRISYNNDLAILRTINDKVINSQEFNSFLFNFLNRSRPSKEAILSQNSNFTKDFNATNFLTTLFYTKYEGQKNEKHILITKGKTKKTALILQTAILKALPIFYENSENSLLSIPEAKSLREKINLLETKSAELISRVNLETHKKSDDLSLISVNSEIKVIQEELSELINLRKGLDESKLENLNEGLLENKYLKNYGKIEEYVMLIQQLSRLSKNTPNSPASKEIISNKAKVSALLLNEYDQAITNLDNDIKNKTVQIKNLKQKVIETSNLAFNSSIPELSLLEKVNFTLQKLRDEYYSRLHFWNSHKNEISFSPEESYY